MVHCTEREVIMKTKINSSVKRVLSLVIAFALLIGTLFTANIGININADAETSSTTVQKTRIVYWNGTRNGNFSSGSGTEADPFIVETAEQFNWLIAGDSNTSVVGTGLYYKVDPTIKAFIMQKETTVDNLGGAEAFMNLGSGEATQEFFEKNMSSLTNWMYNTISYFNGNFDGNGVEIYGVYCDASARASWQYDAGLFPMVDGGKDGEGITIKNFAIRSSYFKSFRRLGIIAGCAYGDDYAAKVAGKIALTNVEATNCHIVGTNKVEQNTSLWATSEDYDEMGILFGNMNADPVAVDNCLVYGNTSEYRLYASATDTEYTSTKDLFNKLFAYNGTNSAGNYGSLKNSVIIGPTPRDLGSIFSDKYGSNNYGDNTDNASIVTSITVSDTTNEAKGVTAKKKMSGLDWAVNGDTAYGKWYVRADDYPTLSYPGTDWKDIEVTPVFGGSAADSFAGGTGTKEDPYIIKTPNQLYKMVQGGTDTKDKYYKVADGVTKLYLSDIEGNENINYVVANKDSLPQWTLSSSASETEVIDSSHSHYSITGNAFWGHFDGNGVTIEGMVSKNGNGFFGGMYGDASIKNVNFENCYVYGAQAAVITTKFGIWNDMDNTHSVSISNVSVRNCYLESTLSYTTSRVATAAGFVASRNTPDMCTITNCLFDLGDGTVKQQTNDATNTNIAGFVSCDDQDFNLINCVSLGLRPFNTPPQANNLGRYDGTKKIYAQYCYTDTALPTTGLPDGFDWANYSVVNNIPVLASAEVSDQSNYEYLDFINNWTMTEVEDGRTIPMPQVAKYDTFVSGEYADYTEVIKNYNGLGLKSGNFPSNSGEYGWQSELTGSGTEADPYIIDTPTKLAIAIATGGQLEGQALYYKLACDIDLGGLPWLDASVDNEKQVTEQKQTQYRYTAFVGTLDGDGHIVKGLRSINSDENLDTFTALIPVLDGGTVKNLHLRNSFVRNAYSDAQAGGIVGYLCTNGSIIGCSTETTSTPDGDADNEYAYSLLCAYDDGEYTVSNSYYITANGTAGYRDADGETPDDATTLLSDTDTWYQVPKSEDNSSDGKVRLVNQLKSGEQFDLDGNGTFDSKDITVLVSKMLGKDGYTNAYADVNYDGRVNILDLVLARRAGVGNFEDTRDGFWRNVELGKVSIYYDCNDNYDSARKLQLYIESVYPTVSITKYTAGTVVNGTKEGTYTNQDNAVVINKTTKLAENKYEANYDYKTNVLTINGGSFTAVEQAVLDLLAQNTHETKSNFATVDGTLASNKNYRYIYTGTGTETVDGTSGYEKFYYAWGDEFESTSKTTYGTDTWTVEPYRSEDSRQDFANMSTPTVESLKDLWVVENGKLTINRGVNTNVYTNPSEYSALGYVGVDNTNNFINYKGDLVNDFNYAVEDDDGFVDAGLITTKKSMMFKQGYSEMRASLPSDGHAFPAWWFYNGTNTKSNTSLTSSMLYGKVYKQNSAWDGVTASMAANDLTTYKYQVPNAYLEFDIVELMQSQSTKKSNVGDWKDYFQLTVHKIYDQNVLYTKNTEGTVTNNDLYMHDWATGTVGSAISLDTFDTTSADCFIHKYSVTATGANYPYTTTSGALWWKDETVTGASFSFGQANSKLGKSLSLTDEYTYGFYWTVEDNTYKLWVYIDFDNDGIMEDNEIIFAIDETTGHNDDKSNDGAWANLNDNDPTYNSGDADIWDQYAFMLLDNAYYTANYNDGTLFTDLFSKETGHGAAGASDKITFDIDYVRVYQQDGRRDLVTTETEAFNTGSHFGY